MIVDWQRVVAIVFGLIVLAVFFIFSYGHEVSVDVPESCRVEQGPGK